MNANRREVVLALSTPWALTAATLFAAKAEARMHSEPVENNVQNRLHTIKACLFDTFGTIVDWRRSILAEANQWGIDLGIEVNWEEFTDRWRMNYAPAMDRVRKGELPWTNLDTLNRSILDKLLLDYRIQGLSEFTKIHWVQAWRRLHPWPDSVCGLERLKKKYLISPLSNANLSLMIQLSKFAQLPWDWIWGTDLIKHYKPDPETYLSAVSYLGLQPSEVLMCAAHRGDLDAARRLGLHTAFISRPNEFGGGTAGSPDTARSGEYDLVCTSVLDLANQLEAPAV